MTSIPRPLRCYRHVLEIDEYGPLAPGDGHQRKFYAPGVGGILTKPAGGRAQESVSLTDVVRLDRGAMAAVRRGRHRDRAKGLPGQRRPPPDAARDAAIAVPSR